MIGMAWSICTNLFEFSSKSKVTKFNIKPAANIILFIILYSFQNIHYHIMLYIYAIEQHISEYFQSSQQAVYHHDRI